MQLTMHDCICIAVFAAVRLLHRNFLLQFRIGCIAAYLTSIVSYRSRKTLELRRANSYSGTVQGHTMHWLLRSQKSYKELVSPYCQKYKPQCQRNTLYS